MDMKMLLWAEEMMKNEYGKVLIWLGFVIILMAIDMVTGFIQAYINHEIKSGKMSTGLLKKFALLLVLVAIIPLTIVLPELFSVSIIVGVYVLETLNEMVSIIENLNKLGVATAMFEPIIKRLQSGTKEDDK
ncbi:phage holin family protein [Candidatus Enterococcus huntleyi]|uniref:phage holin family protein n=1 Tax=Candidatus Enterococcus huntleyi TaxID=1857217 RepID=UPI001379C930|nr:phage holin family protein [Enterococcus sp. JM4C]